MNLLVNLVGGQTIPNLQFLKKFYQEGDHILFINTPLMNNKGVHQWIINSFQLHLDEPIKLSDIINIIVDEYYDTHIKSKLDEIDYDIYDDIIVNVTGGTKIMSLAIFDYFREKDSKIFYITGKDDAVLKLFPNRKKENISLNITIDLSEYLICHGFEIKTSTLSGRSFEFTKSFLNWYVNSGDNLTCQKIFAKLRPNRDKSVNIAEIAGLSDFLHSIDFTVDNGVQLSKYDIRYLTGGWFEEYIYFSIRNELEVGEQFIATGLQLVRDNVSNEFDILFIYNNTLHVIECKTGIVNNVIPTLVNDTFYKLSSLSTRLGLFCKKYVFTLNKQLDFKKQHLRRAEAFDIRLKCCEDILNARSIFELLNENKHAY